MKIKSVRIENLRAFADETIHFNDYTCLVGPNGAGKSTILTALNIFFRDSASSSLDLLNLCEEDFHQRVVKNPIKITVTFGDLSEEAIADFKAYYRQNKLIISAVANWDDKSNTAQVKQFGERMVMADFAEFFRAEGDKATVPKLKEIYTSCRSKHPELPAPGTKQAMIDALHAYEESHSDLCTLLPSEDQFYGFSNADNLLRKYIQWIYIPAVKDAASERTEGRKSALGQLLELTVRNKLLFADPLEGLRSEIQTKYSKILEDNQDKLTELSTSLNAKFRDWTMQDARLKLQWQADLASAIKVNEPLAEVIAGEGKFDGNISRMGHGLQRCFLLTLLQEISGSAATTGPRLLLGVEEPELYQHPPQARHLAHVLQTLSSKNSQIIVSTHSPYFISGKVFEDVRAIRKCTTTHAASARSITVDLVASALATAKGEPQTPTGGMLFRIQQALQPGLNEIFFSPIVVLVEGLEDVAYITSYMILLNRWDEFRRYGCHIVPANGKSQMIQPLAIINHFKIPRFVVFDSDAHQPDSNGSKKKHEKDNKALLSLCSLSANSPMPTTTLWESDCVMWHTEMGDVVESEFGDGNMTRFKQECQHKYDAQIKDLKKNGMFIGCLLEHAWNQNVKSPSLEKLCVLILDLAKAVNSQI